MLPKLPRTQVQKLMRSTTLRGFSGGWNVIDDDMNMPHKFSTKALNVFQKPDGTIQVRYGTYLFSSIVPTLSINEEVVDAQYFIDSFVVVTTNGRFIRVHGDGAYHVLGDMWGPTEFVSFAIFNDQLIAANGSDKPVNIRDDYSIEYLQDEATGSNLNVPVCKYVIAINRYLLMAGDPLFPNRVHISAKDAPGTWFGDPDPNDGTRVEVGSVLPSGNTIRGLMAFRGKVVVMFAEGLVFGTLGVYNDTGSHTPSFEDGVEGFGSISHRAGVAYGDDGLFIDLEGVPSIKRTVLSQSFKPERVSDLIDPEIKKALSTLTFDTLENYVFSVYNKSDAQFLLFVPSEDRTTQRVFVYNYRPQLRQEAWSEFSGWNFVTAKRSQEGNIFFFDRIGNIWLYGTETRPYTRDFIDEVHIDATYAGDPITFDWELPWIDFSERVANKSTRYISFDTRGKSEFTCEMYVDNFMAAPALSTEFSAGDQGGFGDGPQPYGGGRDTSVKKLYAWPAKCEIAKLRFHGSADEGLAFVSISLHWRQGGIAR
jgi:hypothetical protein